MKLEISTLHELHELCEVHNHNPLRASDIAWFKLTLEKIMATQAELATQLNDVINKVGKIGTETQTLLTKVAELATALETAGNTTPEVDAAMAALQLQVTVVDDLVPDAATVAEMHRRAK